jgi:alkylation response protein AidB-like acyl-CoA dehydrogenase
VYPPLSAPMNLQAATVPLTIANWGTPELVERYVPGLVSAELLGCNAMTEPDGGSDFLGAMRTRAVRDGDDYVINGAKMWITNANVADVAVGLRQDRPIGRTQGRHRVPRPDRDPGLRGHPRAVPRARQAHADETRLALTDVRVPVSHVLGAEGQGFAVAMNAMDYGRLSVAARSVGLAQACLDAALEYADQRTAFGQKIGEFQMVKKQLADMTAEVAAARSLVDAAAAAYDGGTVATRESSIAKYFAGEVCNRAARPAPRSSVAPRSATNCRSASTSTTPSSGRPVRARRTSRPSSSRRRSGLEGHGPPPHPAAGPDLRAAPN